MELNVVAVWWLTYVALILAGWPLAGWVLREAPDRGASLAAPLSLAVIALPTLWVGYLSFDAGVLVAIILLAFLSLVAWHRWLDGDHDIRWRELGATLVVFTAAFTIMIVVRAAAPGIYPGGGEKFLDFGILQSLLRAERLPPLDVWYAGEHVLYYYGGHMLAAVLAKTNGTPGVWANAPALSGYFAMQVTAVYGLAQAITAEWRSDPREPAALEVRVGGTLLVVLVTYWLFGVGAAMVAVPAAFALFALSLSAPRRAGLLGAFVFGIASNLLTPLRLAARHLSDATLARVVVTFGPNRDLNPTISPDSFSYWSASRVIPDTVNEFPLFAFRNGDLHAHQMSPTFLLLLVGVLFAYYRAPLVARRRRLLLLAMTAPITALILTVNTWSLPTALGLVVLGIAGARAPPWTLIERFEDSDPHWALGEPSRVAASLALVGVVAGAVVALVYPFLTNIVLAGVGARHPDIFPTRTGLGPFLIVHGGFLLSFAAYTIARGIRTRTGTWLAVLLIPVFVYLGWTYNLVALMLVGPIILGGWWLLRTDRLGFEALLVVAGGGLVVLVEFLYLVDNAGPERFNTVFKVYSQVWTIWSVASGVVLASFAGYVRTASTGWMVSSPGDALDVVRRSVGPILVLFLVVTTSMYGGLVAQSHVYNADEYSLDAMTYAHTQYPDEAAAIEWLEDRPGQPTIVSRPCTDLYRWCNAPSSLTGVQTVLGWGHEAVYRGWDAYNNREVAVNILYDTDDEYSRAILLRVYDVEYIYVGPQERREYDTQDYASEPGIEVAYANDAVVIYQVTQSELTDAPD